MDRCNGPLKSYEYKDVNNKMYYAQILERQISRKTFIIYLKMARSLELTFQID